MNQLSQGSSKSTKSVISFLREALALKFQTRENWTENDRRESVADHSWSLSLMTMVVEPYLYQNLDMCKALKLAIIHDLAEAITGDIPYPAAPDNSIEQLKKIVNEKTAFKKISSILNDKLDSDLYGLWEEYVNGRSYEAQIIKSLDKLDFLIQRIVSNVKLSESEKNNCFKRLDKLTSVDPFIHELFCSIRSLLIS